MRLPSLLHAATLLLLIASAAHAQCSFALTPSSASATSDGGTGSFTINASQSTCLRTASSNANWLTVSAKKAEDFVRSDFAAWKRATSRLKCPK